MLSLLRRFACRNSLLFLHLLALQFAEFPYVRPESLSGFERLAIGKDPLSLSGPGSDGGYCFEQTEI